MIAGVMDPLAVGFLATIHRMLEMQAAVPPSAPLKDISAALAGLGSTAGFHPGFPPILHPGMGHPFAAAVPMVHMGLPGLGAPGSHMLAPGIVIPHPMAMEKPPLPVRQATATAIVTKARKRANLEKKIAEMHGKRGDEEKSSESPEIEILDDNPHQETSSPVPALQQLLNEEDDDELTLDVEGGADDSNLSISSNVRVEQDLENNELFKHFAAADKHVRRIHRKQEKRVPSVCDQCGKQFASGFQLREHVSILHLNERNFECEYCGTKFGRRGGLRRHVQMVHLNQMHMCPYDGCDHPGYKCSKALAAHIRSVHTNQRPYQCDMCGKAFVRRNDLKMHQLTHNKNLSFPCGCGSKFRRQIYLKKHQKNCTSVGERGGSEMSKEDDESILSDVQSNTEDSRMDEESDETTN